MAGERNKATNENLRDALEQCCKDLNQVHTQWMEHQGAEDGTNYDFPEWTPQANTLRWAEKLLGKRFVKDPRNSRFPKREMYE